jgi:nucleobase:cation symporter-1, NCS1 family
VTLLGVFLGSLAANSLNLYSSSLSLAALVMGLVALVIGMLVLQEVNRFTDYLLVVSYRTAPWIGVVLADRLLWRHPDGDLHVFTDRSHVNRAGPIAMAVALVISVAPFGNQAAYVGPVPRAFPEVGDITLEVGLVLAFALYAVLRPLLARR